MNRELQGHPAATMGYSGLSTAGNFGTQGYESHGLYSLQATSAADFHRSFEQNEPLNISCPQQNFSFNDGKLFSAQTVINGNQRLKLCKHLLPAQELLNEFCDLGGFMRCSKQRSRSRMLEKGGAASSASPPDQSFKTLHVLELQKRKANLLSLLEEVSFWITIIAFCFLLAMLNGTRKMTMNWSSSVR